MQGFGLLSLRIVVGLTFIAHGLPKLVSLGGTSPQTIAALFETSGLAPGYPLVVGTGIVDVFAGILLVVGGYSFWACTLLIVTTSIVAWKIHAPHGFFVNWPLTPGVSHGYEFEFVLIGALVCLIFSGPGLFSIDRSRIRKKS